MRPDAPVDTLRTARAVLARLRESAQDCVVSVESVESPHADRLSTLSTLTTQPVDAQDAGTPTELGARPTVNRGMLMTVGQYRGYPPLWLKPGVSIAEGYRAWRTFTRFSDDAMLALAVEAARATWGDDLMMRDLIYVEPITAPVGGDDAGARSGRGPDSRPSPENDDPIHEACRDHERRQDRDER